MPKLGTIDHRVFELEKLSDKQSEDIEALMLTLSTLKKKINSISESVEGLRIEVDILSKVIEEGL